MTVHRCTYYSNELFIIMISITDNHAYFILDCLFDLPSYNIAWMYDRNNIAITQSTDTMEVIMNKLLIIIIKQN